MLPLESWGKYRSSDNVSAVDAVVDVEEPGGTSSVIEGRQSNIALPHANQVPMVTRTW